MANKNVNTEGIDGVEDKLNDLASILNNAVSKALNDFKQLGDEADGLVDTSKVWNGIVNDVYTSSEKLSKQFLNVRKYQQAILKNSKTLRDFEGEALKTIEANNKKRIIQAESEKKTQLEAIASKRLSQKEEQDALHSLQEEYEKILLYNEKIHGTEKLILKEEVERIRETEKYNKLQKASIGNITEGINNLASAMAHPAQTAEGFAKSLGGIPQKLLDAKKEGKSFFSVLGGGFIENIARATQLLGVGGGILVVGFAAASVAVLGITKVFEGFFSLFTNYWNFLDKKVLPAQASFNKEIGNTGEGAASLKKKMIDTGLQFESLGLSFEEGTAAVRDFVKSLGFVGDNKEINEAVAMGTKLQAVYGMSAEEAGNLVKTFESQAGSVESLGKTLKYAENEANKFGIPTHEIIRDIGKYPNIMARFGVANRKEFVDATTRARRYGLEIGKVQSAFGDTLDTFEGSAEAASKMNALFGTSLNTFQLMMEADSTKRMEIVRKAYFDAGNKEWQTLDIQHKNALKNMYGLDEATAELTFASDKQVKSLRSLADQKEKNKKIDDKWNNSLSSIKQTLLPIGFLVDKLMRSMSTFLAKSLGFDGMEGPITKVADAVEKLFSNLFDFFGDPKNASNINNIKKPFEGFLETLSSPEFARSVGVALKQIPETIKTVVVPALSRLPNILSMAESVILHLAANPLFGGSEEAKALLEKREFEEKMKKGLVTQINPNRFEVREVEDALVTKSGQIVKFDPQDNIFATKNQMDEGILSGRGQSGGTNVNEIRMLAKEIANQIVNMSSNNSGNNRDPIQVTINLDGKKVAESLITNSRK